MAKVATPVASPPAGAYASGQTVTLTCATGGSTIFYTTDGTMPTHSAGSPTGTTSTYSTPLSISLGTTLKALGYLAADTDSNVLTALYSQGYTISGSLGSKGAGAVVFVTSAAGAQNVAATTTADGSGNYTTGLVGNGTYSIRPALWLGNFAPGASAVTVSSANVTGVNFTCTVVVYNQLAADTFNRANENPLSQGGNWSTASGWDALLINSDKCQSSTTINTDSQFAGANYSGVPLPADCWNQGKLTASVNNPAFDVYSRFNGTEGYALTIGGNTGSTGSVDLVVQNAGAIVHTGFSRASGFAIAANDVYTIVVIGQNIYGYKNQTPIAAWNDTGNLVTAAGDAFFELDCFTASTDVSFVNFAAGSVTNAPSGSAPSNASVGTDDYGPGILSGKTSIMGTNGRTRIVG